MRVRLGLLAGVFAAALLGGALAGPDRAVAGFDVPGYTMCKAFLTPTVGVSKQVSVASADPDTTAVRLSASFINDDPNAERYAAFEYWARSRGRDSRQKLEVEAIPKDSSRTPVTRTVIAKYLDPNTEYEFQAVMHHSDFSWCQSDVTRFTTLPATDSIFIPHETQKVITYDFCAGHDRQVRLRSYPWITTSGRTVPWPATAMYCGPRVPMTQGTRYYDELVGGQGNSVEGNRADLGTKEWPWTRGPQNETVSWVALDESKLYQETLKQFLGELGVGLWLSTGKCVLAGWASFGISCLAIPTNVALALASAGLTALEIVGEAKYREFKVLKDAQWWIVVPPGQENSIMVAWPRAFVEGGAISKRYVNPPLVNAWGNGGPDQTVRVVSTFSAAPVNQGPFCTRRPQCRIDDDDPRIPKDTPPAFDPSDVDPDNIYTTPDGEPLEPGTAGAGATVLWTGTPRPDRRIGRAGPDTFLGAGGDDRLRGGGNVDLLIGQRGNDLLIGGTGSDDLWGGPGNDQILGGVGADKLIAGTGTDILRGGPGDDTLVGNPLITEQGRARRAPARTTVFGGSGWDLINVDDGRPDDTVDCGRGSRDAVLADRGDRVNRRTCEFVYYDGRGVPRNPARIFTRRPRSR